MNTWLEDISLALVNLGGIAHYDVLYDEVKRIRSGALPISWRQIIRRTIQEHSTDAESFRGTADVFYSVKGIGFGVWGLRSFLQITPSASDVESPSVPERSLIKTYRVLRDTELARKIKVLHKNICQLCGETVMLKDGTTYAEAHHIKPLGKPHNGPDIAENIVVLCPNHHVILDYGVIPLDVKNFRSIQGHVINSIYVDYHNNYIYGCSKS